MRSDAPIFGFNAARDAIVRTVVDRVVAGTRGSRGADAEISYAPRLQPG